MKLMIFLPGHHCTSSLFPLPGLNCAYARQEISISSISNAGLLVVTGAAPSLPVEVCLPRQPRAKSQEPKEHGTHGISPVVPSSG